MLCNWLENSSPYRLLSGSLAVLELSGCEVSISLGIQNAQSVHAVDSTVKRCCAVVANLSLHRTIPPKTAHSGCLGRGSYSGIVLLGEVD